MLPSDVNVLVACEESQAVCSSFRARGFSAFSCDLVDCSGCHPEWHLRMDALEALSLRRWHLFIAHPPCTYLCKPSAAQLFARSKYGFDGDRFRLGLSALRFFHSMLSVPIPFVCVENPTPLTIWNLPHPSQVLEPWEFGDPWHKRTCLWLRGLPVLLPTSLVVNHRSWHDHARGSVARSKTFPGVARAMAAQWGDFLLEVLDGSRP